MKTSYAILAACNLLLIGLTLAMGFAVQGQEGFTRHFLLGILTAMFTCFIHVVYFVYFIVQDKIITQSILNAGLDAHFGEQITKLKSRALKLSMSGIVTIILASSLGAASDIYVRPLTHGIAACVALAANAIVFYFQYILLHEYREVFRSAFNE